MHTSVRREPHVVASLLARGWWPNSSCCLLLQWLQVTGQGLDLIRIFYNLLPQRHNW